MRGYVLLGLLLYSIGSRLSFAHFNMPQVACPELGISRPLNLREAIGAAIDQQPQLLIAQQEVEKARAGLVGAMTPFLPQLNLSYQADHFVPRATKASPVTVGSSIVGGQQEQYASYLSLGLTWNLYNGGKDVAGYLGARAGVRASEAALDDRLNETLKAVLVAYSDLYKAQVTVQHLGKVLQLSKQIQKRAEERYRHGSATAMAVSHARNASFEVERDVLQACRIMANASGQLASAMGTRMGRSQILYVREELPEREPSMEVNGLDATLEDDPAVIAAKEKVLAAENRVQQARAAFQPILAVIGRTDFLGQSMSGYGAANQIFGYNSYHVGVVIQQPLVPLTSEYGGLKSAIAELEKARAEYQQLLIDTEARLRAVLNTKAHLRQAALSARSSVKETLALTALAESLYQAKRADLDTVERARIELERSERLAEEMEAEMKLADWLSDRVLDPGRFVSRLLSRLGLKI